MSLIWDANDRDRDDWTHRYDERGGRGVDIAGCCQCGSKDVNGRRYSDQLKPYCASCWIDYQAWLKAQKVSA